ncbi:helix-turn-helix domain-containing protein [Larkinella bovis]|uniref:Helix-turn-helix domain-containing protein n=1 Tax=Larkinella bovis TaxID=683041 RepID=A0ABW0IIR3_9BACT
MTEIFENIRKLYQFHVPDNELADFIEFFSESSATETFRHVANNRFNIRMFPSWTPTFYINLGEPYQLSVGPRNYQIGSRTDVLILRNTLVERYNLPTDHILTVKFFPGGLEAVLGINQAQLADQVVNLETVLPPALLQHIKQRAVFEERLELLQQFFLEQFRLRKKTDHYRTIVTDTIGTFGASGMELKTGQLADQLFVTSKTINRYFSRVIGTPPKTYLATVRTRAALTAYVADKKAFTPYDYGYFDMSHFYKDVIKFTGRTLRENIG